MHTETGEALPACPPPAAPPAGGQALLFDDLPETAPPAGRRRRAAAPRRNAAASVAVDQVHEPVPPAQPAVPSLPPLFAAAPPPVDPLDPARLSPAEIRALVQALPDAKLSHLLTEAARELKHRVTAGNAWDDDADGERDAEPNPLLLRAARQAVGELSGDDT